MLCSVHFVSTSCALCNVDTTPVRTRFGWLVDLTGGENPYSILTKRALMFGLILVLVFTLFKNARKNERCGRSWGGCGALDTLKLDILIETVENVS